MTTDGNPVLASQVDALEEFARRVTDGLRARSDAAVESAPATLEPTRAETLAEELPLGALLGRTRWVLEDGLREGCFLWAGGWEILLGQAPRSAELLTTEDVALLDQSLRLMLDEGGEGPSPLEWTTFEGIESAKIPEALAAIGIHGEIDAVQVRIGVGGSDVRFLFLAAETGGAQAASDSARSLGARDEALALTGSGSAWTGSPAGGGTAHAAVPGELGNLEHLLDVKIPLQIRLGSTRMKLEDVLRIAPGAILELDRREEEPLEVLANGRVIARGQVVVVDERFGLKITEIGSSSERLRAAG
jgi:flagellar motor switch protein FliN/FliY